MFTKITKKSFIEQMTSASVIYVSGGFTSRDLTDGEFEGITNWTEGDIKNFLRFENGSYYLVK